MQPVENGTLASARDVKCLDLIPSLAPAVYEDSQISQISPFVSTLVRIVGSDCYFADSEHGQRKVIARR